jgi:hypothetical protein
MSRAQVVVAWHYGDTWRENGRVIRNMRAAYNALIRIDDVRWRVLAGTWTSQHEAMQALRTAKARRSQFALEYLGWDIGTA